jgi:hypothetical protein
MVKYTQWKDGDNENEKNYPSSFAPIRVLDNTVNADDWTKLFYALAYSNGQQLTNTALGSDRLIQSTHATLYSATQRTTSVGVPIFAQNPISSQEELSDLLDSPQATV